jgi:hypothetical protein
MLEWMLNKFGTVQSKVDIKEQSCNPMLTCERRCAVRLYSQLSGCCRTTKVTVLRKESLKTGERKETRIRWEEKSDQRQLEEPASDWILRRDGLPEPRKMQIAGCCGWRLGEKKDRREEHDSPIGRRCIYAASLSTQNAPLVCAVASNSDQPSLFALTLLHDATQYETGSSNL